MSKTVTVTVKVRNGRQAAKRVLRTATVDPGLSESRVAQELFIQVSQELESSHKKMSSD